MKFKQFIIITMLLVTLFPATAQVKEKTYIILYDESHEQFFSSELMQTALKNLPEALGVDITVRINTEDFTPSSVQGSDLIIISNPGADSEVKDGEKAAIDTYVSNGGGVLYMSNPFNYNSTLTGHANTLKGLLTSQFNAFMRVDAVDTDNTSLIIDDYNNDGDDSHVIVNVNNLETEVFRTEPNNLSNSQFLLYSGLVSTKDLAPIYYGNASEFSYAVTQNYEMALDTEKPAVKQVKWMEAKEIGNNSRVMLLGSTIMFSDYNYDNQSTWIEQYDNELLFQNIVAWMMHLTPKEKQNELVGDNFAWFRNYNIFVAIAFGIVLFVLWFGSLIVNGKISTKNLLSISKPKSEKTGKKKKKQIKKETTKKTTKKSKKRV